MSRQWRIELPLPPKACSKNYRGYTLSRSRAVRDYRRLCALTYRRHRIPTLGKVRIHLHYHLYRNPSDPFQSAFYYPRDLDGARVGFAAGQDALQDAGVVPQDSHRYVLHGETRILSRRDEHQGKTGLVVIIEEIED